MSKIGLGPFECDYLAPSKVFEQVPLNFESCIHRTLNFTFLKCLETEPTLKQLMTNFLYVFL